MRQAGWHRRNYPVPAKAGTGFFIAIIILGRNYEKYDKTMADRVINFNSGEDGVLPKPFTIHHSLFTKKKRRNNHVREQDTL